MGQTSSDECSIFWSLCGRDAEEISGSARNSASGYLDEKRARHSLPTMQMRTCFVQAPSVTLPVNVDHTHGRSASDRSSGSVMIGHIASLAGRDPLYFQGSAADVRNGRSISRSYHWVKDLNAPASSFEPTQEDFVAMVDVDYYVDMNKFLSERFLPVVLYTFQPSTLGCSEGEFGFHFNADGEVVYDVSGGSSYGHRIWHYTGDSLKVTKSKFGFVYETSTYALEKRGMGPHHQLVLLAPLAKFKGFAGWVADKILEGGELKRFDPRVGEGFTRMIVQTKEGLACLTGRTGDHSFASVPKAIDDEIASIARTSKTFSISMVKAKVQSPTAMGLPILYEYHCSKRVEMGPKMAVVDPYVKSYQYVPHLGALDSDQKPALVSFMKPLVDAAYCPSLCKNNEERAVSKRVTELATKDLPVSAFLLQVMQEFVGCLAEGLGAGRLVPVEIPEVYARQNRPTQQRILEAAEHEEATKVTKTFVKREAYGEPNDPRIISQINGVDKREYSRFMYALSDYLKDMPWYASGRSNASIAERLAEVCDGQEYVVLTDFSRMDGRVGNVARQLERMLMSRVFPPSDHAVMLRLMEQQYRLKGRSTNGVLYDTGYSRCSGSPETSCFNVLLNAFTAFLALRMEYHCAEAAWLGLGIYMGDDGVSAGIPKKTYEKAAKTIGQVLTAEIVVKSEKGVNFLSRRYGPDVWYGDSNSMLAPARALSKFHVTVHMPSNVSKATKLVDKSFALWLNDANTPIIGDFVSKVVKIGNMNMSKFKNLTNAWGLSDTGTYPNEKASWMDDVIREELPDFNTDGFTEWLEGVSSLVELLAPPVFNVCPEPKPKPGLLELEGDILEVKKSPANTENSSESSGEWITPKTKRSRTKPKAKAALPNPKAPCAKRTKTQKPSGQKVK